MEERGGGPVSTFALFCAFEQRGLPLSLTAVIPLFSMHRLPISFHLVRVHKCLVSFPFRSFLRFMGLAQPLDRFRTFLFFEFFCNHQDNFLRLFFSPDIFCSSRRQIERERESSSLDIYEKTKEGSIFLWIVLEYMRKRANIGRAWGKAIPSFRLLGTQLTFHPPLWLFSFICKLRERESEGCVRKKARELDDENAEDSSQMNINLFYYHRLSTLHFQFVSNLCWFSAIFIKNAPAQTSFNSYISYSIFN